MGQILIHKGVKKYGLSHQKWSTLAYKYPIGWKHTKGEPLFTKKSFIMSIIVHSMLKFWWYFLAIRNTSKKNLNLHDNIMELKVHFESKLIFIQRLAEGNCIQLMYIQYITYNFSMAIGPHVCDSWNITKQKKFKKIIQFPSIKSPPLWYGSGFFL
jgi:hypothetical protein